ncbi:MAG: Na/Pi cotransporter family protein [Lachnospiraceae bacterium]|nr:Na/Pi cotransporter family protein [Lachnospiraceae bacterium]
MKFTDIMGLLGGLALFLYGMQMMSAGLEAAAGNKMKQILEKLTANRFLGVLVGAVITAIIQSSSATTVMVVGFVNSGMMTLRQAVWIIMGANIGTTITGQLIALDVGAIAPIIAFLGVAVVVFSKNVKLHHIGNIFAGLGILFIGMDMMGAAMKPLQNSQAFVDMLTTFENPVLGILAGTIFTAIIQSSSASVGILQALSASGIIGLSSAAYVLFGMNIGTCITAFLASIGTNRNARRTTVIHVSFNVIGTCIFTTLCILTPLVAFMESLAPGNGPAQIANLHTIFNIVTTCLLIPFGNLLAKFSEKILPDVEEEDGVIKLQYLPSLKSIEEDRLGLSAISMDATKNEIHRMMVMAKKNISLSFDAFMNRNTDLIEEVDQTEEYIDFLNKEISKYISKVITHERNEYGSKILNAYFKITSNVERIGDHAINICGYSKMLKERNIQFSEIAQKEIREMKAICDSLMEHLLNPEADAVESYGVIASMEQKIDDMTKQYRENMLERISKGTCTDEGSILYSEMLTDFERIGDHALNISKEMTEIQIAQQ